MASRTTAGLGAALGLGLLLSGCVLSLEEVVPASGSTFDARLLGTWEKVSGTDRAVVSRAADSTYTIELTSDGKVGRFAARLGRLADRPVLDLWPAPGHGELPQPYGDLLVAGHLLLAVDVGQYEIRVAALQPDSLLAALDAGQVRLAHQRSENRLILHGSTGELRSALGPYLARDGALTEPDVYRRPQRAGPAARAAPVSVPCFEASAWREADRLFHRDPRWMGADVASSVDLGAGRTLWLFGDTWIDPSGRGTRRGARMVSNSVAIQVGTDPATAAITFYWGRAADGSPAPFFPERGAASLWLGNGIRVGDRLVIFFAPTLRGAGAFGFEHAGWTAVMVENPDADPPAWRVRPLDTPTNPLGVLVGFAAVLQLSDRVYALGSENPVKSHPIYAARWTAEQVRRGDLHDPEWWAGQRLGWVPDSSPASRWPLFENAQSELSVHVDQATGRLLAVHTQGFGGADIVMRAAPGLTGPWSEPRTVYRPPEYYRPGVFMYAGKAHPNLTGADLVLTYATNGFEIADVAADTLIYYPRFVRLTRCGS